MERDFFFFFFFFSRARNRGRGGSADRHPAILASSGNAGGKLD